jgi:acyl-CoA thioester hydrolase
MTARCSPEFRLELTVAPADVDELGHVSNLVYVRWVLEVAVAHSAAAGLDGPAYRALNAAFVVRRHEIDYMAPAFAGERVSAITWIEDWRAAASTRCTSIRRASDATELARARTLWVYVTLDGGRPRRIPPELQAAFARPVA